MNTYMETEIRNMQALLKTFEKSCEMAALQNDGRMDRKEKRQIKRIKKATEKFSRELSKI